MVDLIFYFYISVITNVLSHEMGHYFAAHILKVATKKVEIGPRFMAINLGKFRVSPLAYKGRITIEANFQSKIQAIVFYLGGVIGNLFVVLVSSHILSGPFKLLLQLIALAQIVSSLLPICESDMSELLKVIRY